MPKLIEVAPADANPEFEAAPKANGRHGKHKKKGGGGVVARVTARLKGAAGGSSRTSSYKAHQVAVKPKGGDSSERLHELQKKNAEKAWYAAHRPDLGAAPDAAAAAPREPAKKITFRKTMTLGHPTVVWQKSLSAVLGRDYAILHAFHECAKKRSTDAVPTLHRHACKKFFKKLNGVEPPPDALDHIDADAGIDEATVKYKVEDYNEYMKRRDEIRARHKDWISRYRSYSADGCYYQDDELRNMVADLCAHKVDEDALRAALAATGAVEKPLKIDDAHKFVVAYEKQLQEDDALRERRLREHPGCLRALFRCLLCIPI